MGTQPQSPVNGATQASEEQRNFAALDAVISETERAAKERILVSRAELDYNQRLARAFAQSGCFADIKDTREETAIAKALVKIMLGKSMGFSEAEAMSYVELIQGRPAISAHGRAAKMKAAGYSWKFLKFDTNGCQLQVFDKAGQPLGDSGFTLDDAKRMDLAEKDNWKKQPRNMLYCRAISNAQRWYAPEVLSAALASTEEVIDEGVSWDNREPIRATVSLDAVKASTDENRGHDATNPANGSGAAIEGEPVEAQKEIKRHHPKNGVPVFSDLLPFDQVTDGQKIYVRTQAGDELFQFDAANRRWVRLE